MRPMRALAQAGWLFPGYSARSQVHLKKSKGSDLEPIKNCTAYIPVGGSYICAAGPRTTEWGRLLCGQETSHVTVVVEHRKAPGAAGGCCGGDGEWRCGGGVLVTAAHSAGASAARDIDVYSSALCLLTWKNTGPFDYC